MTPWPDAHAQHAPAWRWPLAYIATALVFLAMDALWLSTMSARLYQPAIGHLIAPTVDGVAAAAFYLLYVGGLVFFAVAPALAAPRLQPNPQQQPQPQPRAVAAVAFGRGAFFGLLAYATYDLTNQATLRDWPWLVTLLDLAWGAVASAVASGAGAAITLVTCQRASRDNGR